MSFFLICRVKQYFSWDVNKGKGITSKLGFIGFTGGNYNNIYEAIRQKAQK